MKLVLATHNRDKARELVSLLGDTGLEVLTLDAFPQVGSIEEDGQTFEENATKKAKAVFYATGLLSLADDSGLEVFYLNGEPGVYSSRYAGPRANSVDNCNKLLKNLLGVPPRRRTARFRCVLALAGPDSIRLVEGVCNGKILEEPRGVNGFGYDPLFVPDGHALTFAEMDAQLKNRLSHRAKAYNVLRDVVRPPIGGNGKGQWK